ncbi:MAG TPA: LEA type 2 family protein [Rhodanobacteraceae bacterium]|nr:LEA type 2 family protein [Rhodanobacteraceae bacterium]
MILHVSRMTVRAVATAMLLGGALVLAGCTGVGTKLQPPTASIQQLTVQSDGTWVAVVRVQNYSYDTGMHVYAIDAALSMDGKPAGQITLSPGLDIPAMDADTATANFKPEAQGAAALAAAKGNAIAYELKGTLSVGKGTTGKAEPFKLDGRGYLSPVPGVSNIWR